MEMSLRDFDQQDQPKRENIKEILAEIYQNERKIEEL